MQESNFEKQVQQKLDELRLTPSQPVWQNIEVAIRKKKDRRLVFWLLPVLLLAGGLFWWQKGTWHSEKVTQQPVSKTLPPAQPTFSKPHTDQANQTVKTTIQQKAALAQKFNEHITSTQKEKTHSSIAKEVVSGVDEKEIKSSKTEKRIAKQQVVSDRKLDAANQGAITQPTFKSSSHTNSNKGIAKASHEKTAVPGVGAQHFVQDTLATVKKKVVVEPDSIIKVQNLKKDSIVNVVHQPSIKINMKRPLQWSIVGRIGASNQVQSLSQGLGLEKSIQPNVAADYLTGSPAYSDSLNVNSVYKQPVAPTKGKQFSIGTVLKKPVAKTSFITAGLQYSYYSYHLAVGTQLPSTSLVVQRVASPQKTFLNNGNKNAFTNTLHVIELPVGYEYKLLKNLPLHVQHGITVSQVVSSKVLQYDYSSNTYYQRSAGLRKTGVSAFTVVDYTIWEGKAFSLQAGPYLQYGLQPLFKSVSNNRLLSGGLTVTMTF